MNKLFLAIFIYFILINTSYLTTGLLKEDTGSYASRIPVTKISSHLEMKIFLDKHPISLVLFFASCKDKTPYYLLIGCGFCHVVLSELALASNRLVSSYVSFGESISVPAGIASVRCDKVSELCDTFHIDGYPTLLSFQYVCYFKFYVEMENQFVRCLVMSIIGLLIILRSTEIL